MSKLMYLLLGFVLSSLAQAQVNITTYPIPVHVESETKGLFIELTRAVARETHIDIHLSVLPPPRAVQSFETGSQSVLFPAMDVLFPAGAKIVRTREAIDCKEDFIFTRKGSPLLRTLNDLKGKRVGITRGYPYAREVQNNKLYMIEEGLSDEINIKKLMAGRIDAFILDEKTGIAAFEKMGLSDQMQYPARQPVSHQEVYYAFQNTAEGRQLAGRFSDALAKLKREGEYQTITRGITFEKGCPR
jgi:polar amino acid transport system substrate-binding protein